MSLALLQSALLLPLELTLNQLLALDQSSREKLAELEGGTLAVEVSQPSLSIFITASKGGLRLSSHHEGLVSTTVAGSATSLLQLLLKRQPVSNLRNSNVELRGSTAFAQSLQNLLLGLRIDWEYQLSRLIGDLPTQFVASGINKSQDYLQRTGERIKQDLGDFLQEEGRLVPATSELEQFYQDVQALVLRLDRLDARLAQATLHKG